ncbi:MAG: anti-sigma factor, partial [Phycisphaerae bacterium]|nr:anti-sigma factor [Phycisphaerae bacterium]
GLAAAALDVALTGGSLEAMPDDVRQAAILLGGRWMHQRPDWRSSMAASQGAVPNPAASIARLRWLATAGWLAAAACLAIATLAWRPFAVREPGPVSLRSAMIEQAPIDLISWTWTATEDPAAQGATGDVVWSSERQEGYMRLCGLAVNDPAREQYQLWIFDQHRPAETPVDGGVFDVSRSTGEVVIAIDPKVRVFEAAMFAVTVEKPGGAVVSRRERIPLLAKPTA